MMNFKRYRDEEKKYFDIKNIVKNEIIQKNEEGYNVLEIRKKLLNIRKEEDFKYKNLLEDLKKSTIRSNYPYKEPSELKNIDAERSKKLIQRTSKTNITLTDSDLYDKIYGGWLGRCAGCLLGKPVEGLNKTQIEEWLRKEDTYPLTNYFPVTDEMPERAKKGVLLGNIKYMPHDDDTDYTIIGLQILENCGIGFTPINVGENWICSLPYWQTHTAERAAYKNMINGILPPESAIYMNPYREWIGAQIRADMWGYITPGMPLIGADLAYRDAILSHVKNGIYGEMLVSAMICAAFTTNNIDSIIETGLSVIPIRSRLAEAVKRVVNWSKEYTDWKDTWNKIMLEFKDYYWIHVIVNAAIVIMGLLYGKGNYEKSITIGVMGGLDTDCNGATIGSILGVILGANALPDKWIKPLNDRIESHVIGFNESHISDLAKRTLRIYSDNFL